MKDKLQVTTECPTHEGIENIKNLLNEDKNVSS